MKRTSATGHRFLTFSAHSRSCSMAVTVRPQPESQTVEPPDPHSNALPGSERFSLRYRIARGFHHGIPTSQFDRSGCRRYGGIVIIAPGSLSAIRLDSPILRILV